MTENTAPLEHKVLEEMVHRFLDGELDVEHEAEVFTHLAACASCRSLFGHVLAFRRIIRQEHLAVPPAVDEAFLQRLESHKETYQARDRSAERDPLWQTRRRVSLGAALIAGAALLLLGLLTPAARHEMPPGYVVRGESEQVEFRDVIYVIYPGLTVEAAKL